MAFPAAKRVPLAGHVGPVPSRANWARSVYAVRKSACSAVALPEEVQAHETAGASAVEIAVVLVKVASEISRRVGILLWSMGSGYEPQCLFAEDIPGANRGHMPRHSGVCRNFAAEFDRLRAERIAAFPGDRHVVRMDAAELAAF